MRNNTLVLRCPTCRQPNLDPIACPHCGADVVKMGDRIGRVAAVAAFFAALTLTYGAVAKHSPLVDDRNDSTGPIALNQRTVPASVESSARNPQALKSENKAPEERRVTVSEKPKRSEPVDYIEVNGEVLALRGGG